MRVMIAWLMLLTLAALGLRLSLIPTRSVVENDGPYYVALAQQLLRGEWSGALNDYWSQLYPVMIAGMALFVQDAELAARLISALCGAALVPAVWWLVNEIADEPSAHLAAILTAFHPWLLASSTLTLTEMPFALFLLLALTAILRAGRLGGLRRFALAGGLTGLAILTRSEGMLLVLALAGAGLARLVRARGWSAAREGLAAAAALVFIMAPQSIGTYRLYGHLNFMWKSSVGVALSEAFNRPGQAEPAIYRLDENGQPALPQMASETSFGDYWLRHSNQALGLVGEHARLLWRDRTAVMLLPDPWTVHATSWWLWLAAAGILKALTGTKRGAALAVLGFVTVYSLGLLSVLVHSRLLIPLIAFSLSFSALGAVGLVQAAGWIVKRIGQPAWQTAAARALLIPAGAALLYAGSISYRTTLARIDTFMAEPAAEKEAGLWLRANLPQTENLLSHNPQTPFYFYEDWPFERARALPWAPPDEVLAYADEQQAEYIVLEEWVIRAAHFPVEPWLDLSISPPGLRLVKVFGAEPNRVIIYHCIE